MWGGGGLGYYSKAFQDSGFEVTTIDIDKLSIDFASKKLLLSNVFHGSADSFIEQHQDKKFDVVFARHVIEHCVDPRAFVIQCKSLLNDNGILILETDNSDSCEIVMNFGTFAFYINLYKRTLQDFNVFKLLLNPIFAINPPGHLHTFKISNLKKLLSDCSLNVLYAGSYCFGSDLWSNIPNTKFVSILRSIMKFRIRETIKSLYNILFYIPRQFLNILKRGAGIIILCSK